MDGLFIPVDFNMVYFSTPRSMARFGLLNLAEGVWDGQEIINPTYFNEMVNTSQNLNESYGYLWWLNGKDSFMLPQTQIVFDGSISPNAPADMYAALGANSQIINVIPSLGMVWMRMGEDPNNSNVALELNDEIWTYINEFECNPLAIEEASELNNLQLYPNPTSHTIQLSISDTFQYVIYNTNGAQLRAGSCEGSIDMSDLATGMYFIRLQEGNTTQTFQVIKD